MCRGEAGESAASRPPLLQFMKFMPPSMLVFVTLKYQGKAESLFLKNPAPLWCFIASTCTYWLIAGVMKNRTPTPINGICFKMLYRAAIAASVLSALSLFSVFLPYPFSILPLVIWPSLSMLWILYEFVRRGIARLVTMFQAMVVWAGNMTEEEADSQVWRNDE